MLTKSQLQRLRTLREKKHREALGLFVVEGDKVVGELLADGFPLVEIYATPGWSGGPAAGARGLRPVSVTAAEMARVSHYPTPSPVLAVGRIVRARPAPAKLARGLTLDGVQDPGNVGTLLRVADWFALARVVLSPGCADLFHQRTIDASMGSFARVAVHTTALPELLESVPAGLPVLGCDLTGDDVHTLPPLGDAIIVIGAEGRGLSSDVAARLTRRVTIPRYGSAESLNAAVAAAIVCDQLRRSPA
jgi:TrmH family RNA methyltransferase